MAEKKGFFRRIFSFASAPEDERVPEHGETPRPADTLVSTVPGAPDPGMHQAAAADTLTDSEAGTSAQEGGITPLEPRGEASDSSGADVPQTPAAEPGTAEKKTPASMRSRWGS